jgi:hypothetical protein
VIDGPNNAKKHERRVATQHNLIHESEETLNVQFQAHISSRTAMIYEIHDSRDDCTVFIVRRGASDEDSWNEYKYGNIVSLTTTYDSGRLHTT